MKTKVTSIKTTLIVAGLLAAFASASRGAEVKENWEKNCQKCHGPLGKGDGPDSDKNEPAAYSRNFKAEPWTVAIEGECAKPGK